jgi:hypothetical protein
MKGLAGFLWFVSGTHVGDWQSTTLSILLLLNSLASLSNRVIDYQAPGIEKRE